MVDRLSLSLAINSFEAQPTQKNLNPYISQLSAIVPYQHSVASPTNSEISIQEKSFFEPTQTLSYGKDLWDSLQTISDNTQHRLMFMNNLRSFFNLYRKAFDQLGTSLTKANQRFEKDFIIRNQNGTYPQDTLSTAMMEIKKILDDTVKQIHTKSERLMNEIIDPLETYHKQYNNSNQELIKQATQFWSNLHNERTNMLFAKQNYFNQMQTLEIYSNQIGQIISKFDGSDQTKEISQDSPYYQHDKKLAKKQLKATQGKVEYEKTVQKVNDTIEKFDSQYRPILKRLQDNDLSQIDYMKHNLDSFANILSTFGIEISCKGEEIKQNCSKISQDTDINIFIQSFRTQNPFIQKEEIQVYEDIQAEVIVRGKLRAFSVDEGNTWPDPRKGTPKNSDKMFLFGNDKTQRGVSVGKIIFGSIEIKKESNPKEERKAKLLASLKENYTDERDFIYEKMNALIHSQPISQDDQYLINILLQDKELWFSVTEVLNDQNNRKNHLCKLISDHSIWQEDQRWRQCIQEIVSMKVEDAVKRAKHKHNQAKTAQQFGESKEGKSFFKNSFKSIKGVFTSKEKNLQVELKQQQNLVFNEMSRFVNSLINFKLPYDQANQILIHFCNTFQLEQSRVHLLLTELVSNQKNPSKMFTDKEQLIWSLQRRGNRLKAFGFSEKMQIVGMTIKFIDQDSTLRKLRFLSKDFNDLLKHEILQQSLMRSSKDKLKDKRRLLWLKILDIDTDFAVEEYHKYLELSQTEALSKVISDAIEVDVQRSYNHMTMLTSNNLNNILRAYAVCDRELDYCQGMNFIAGFLYILYESEALAFSVMKEVINKFKMTEMFNQELPMLKLNFYQLDRLISIILPDLHMHLKEENISCSYYSAPYFITLFTSVLQTQTTGDNCERLLRFWDYFILQGWKAVFKVTLLILKEYEEQLLAMPFEIVLTQIVSMPNRFFIREFVNHEEELHGIQKFDQAMCKLKIPEMLLERLKKEFDDHYELSIQTSSKGGSNKKKDQLSQKNRLSLNNRTSSI